MFFPPPPKWIQSLPAEIPNTAAAMTLKLPIPYPSMTPRLKKELFFSDSLSFVMCNQNKGKKTKEGEKGGFPSKGQLNIRNKLLKYGEKVLELAKRVFKMWEHHQGRRKGDRRGKRVVKTYCRNVFESLIVLQKWQIKNLSSLKINFACWTQNCMMGLHLLGLHLYVYP